MSTVSPTASSSLMSRVKGILFQPKAEWERIDGEPASVKGLILGYAAILAAIGPIASLIGGQVFGYSAFGVSYRTPIVSAVIGAVIAYVLTLVGVFVLALIIDALAPSFGGTKDRIQATKVAVYASTASWVAGIFGLVPMLALLSILGLYSLYLLYLGLPRLMRTPADKALGYTVVVIIVAIVVSVVITMLTAAVMASVVTGAAMGAASFAS